MTQTYRPASPPPPLIPDRFPVNATQPLPPLPVSTLPASTERSATQPPSETSEPTPTEELSDLQAFKAIVRGYVSIESRLSALSQEAKELREKREKLREQITEFMGHNDIGDLHTRDMRLQLKTVIAKVPLKKADIRERVTKFFGSEESAAPFFEQVYENQETVQRTQLRKSGVKKVTV